MRAHIGSWVNSHTVFESITNGFDVAAISESKKLDKPIEMNRWYDIKIEVGNDRVDCFLDGKLLMTYTQPQSFFSIAGMDEATGDIVVKVVNAAATPYPANILLTGSEAIKKGADLFTLRADSLTAENSFAAPLQYIPRHQQITNASSSFELTFTPYSINVLRLHTR